MEFTEFFALLPGISRQCCRTRNSKSACQVFEPGLRLDRLNKTIWGEVLNYICGCAFHLSVCPCLFLSKQSVSLQHPNQFCQYFIYFFNHSKPSVTYSGFSFSFSPQAFSSHYGWTMWLCYTHCSNSRREIGSETNSLESPCVTSSTNNTKSAGKYHVGQ